MKVRIIIGARNAYAAITCPGRSLDVMLQPGKSAADSLTASAAEMREKAAAMLERADVMAAAAITLAHGDALVDDPLPAPYTG